MIDSHTHLDSTPREADIVAARAGAGVTRMLTIGTDGASCRAARSPRRSAPAGRPRRSAATPTAREGFTTPTRRAAPRSPAHPRCRAIGETGLDFYRDRAPEPTRSGRSPRRSSSPASVGKPLVIHTRAAEDDTIATLERDAEGVEVVLHCFSMPDRLEECLNPGWCDLLRRQRDLPEGRDLAVAGGARARSTGCWSRPTRRTSRRRPCARSATSRPTSCTPRASSPSGAASPTRSSRRPSRRNAAGAVRLVSGAPRPAEPAPPAGVRRAAQARARPELPDRLEHPRASSRAPRSSAPATSCSRSAAGSACCPSTSRRGRPTSTSSSSTAASSRPLRDALDPFPNVTLHFADARPARPRRAGPGADEGRRQPARTASPRR